MPLSLHPRRARSTSRSGLRRAFLPPLAVLVIGLSCGDGPTEPRGDPIAALVASLDSIVVAPGDRIQLRAEASSASGTPIRPVDIEWRSLDDRVVAVSAEGVLNAQRSGEARVVARARGRADTVHVIVLPPLVETTLSSDLATLSAIGQRAIIQVSSRSTAGPRLGQYTITSRDSATARPFFNAEAGVLTVIGERLGSTWVVVKEREGTADSVRIVVDQRAARISLAETLVGYVGGTFQLTPGVYDAGDRAVVSPVIAWRSEDETVATVSSSGLVTFKALGTTVIEARAGDTAYAAIGITVSASAAPRISFRQDSVTVGTGLVTSHLTVNLANHSGVGPLSVRSLDPAIAEVTLVQASSDGAVFTVTGRSAGLTRIVAGAGTVQPDTMIARVSTSRLRVVARGLQPIAEDRVAVGSRHSYGAIVRDSANVTHARVVPVTVTLRSSDTSVVRITDGHSVLTIEAGDNGFPMANVIPVAPGRAVLRATAPGLLADSVIITVEPRPRLSFMPSRVHSVALGYTTSGEPFAIGTTLGWERGTDVEITLTRRHPEIATAPATVSLPSNFVSRGIRYTGLAFGTDTIIATAPGYDPDTAILIVTSPALVPFPPMRPEVPGVGALWLRVTDSLGIAMQSLAPRVFRVSSSDTSVARPLAFVEIPKDVYWQWPVSVGARSAGTATITIADTTGLIRPQSAVVLIVEDTSLVLGNQRDVVPLAIGTRQRFWDDAFYVIRDQLGTGPVVHLRSTDPSVLVVPDSVVIGNTRGTHIPVAGGDRPGSASIVATARGYRSVTFGPIHVGRPELDLVAPESVYVGGSGYKVQVVARDHRGKERNTTDDVPVEFAALDGGLSAPATTVATGATRSAEVPLTITAPGTLRLAAHDPRTATWRYDGDTSVIVAMLPTIALAGGGERIYVGVGQRTWTSLGRPGNVASQAATVSIARGGSRTTSPATMTIPAGTPSVTYNIVGRAVGVDTLTPSSAGHASRSIRVIVTEGRITTGLVLPSTLGLNKSFFTRFSVGDSLGFAHPVDAATTFHLWGNGVEFFEAEGATRITSITIPAGASQTPQFRVVGTATGIASVEVTNIAYRTERGQVHVIP